MRQTLSFDGAFRKGDPDLPFRYFEFEMPAGATRLEVSYHFLRDDAVQPEWGADDVVDIGVFDTRGIDMQGGGFRGWTGSSRRQLYITPGSATPGYIRGPLQPGPWNVFLGARLLNGEAMPYWINVNIDADPDAVLPEASFPQDGYRVEPPTNGTTRRWYRGDFHSHTLHSDGYNSIDEYAVAADRLGLDFLAITDHNTWSHFDEILHRSPNMSPLLIPGEEVTTFWGHANVWGAGCWVDFRAVDDAAMQATIDWVHERGGLFSPNHPKRGWPWEFSTVRGFQVCEAWQGAWRMFNVESLDFWEQRLRAGERVVTVGGSDCHSVAPAKFLHPWTLGNPCTWVYAREPLCEANVIEAVRAGHVFVSEDTGGPFLELSATCGGQTYLMGDTIAAPQDAPVTLRLRYRGPPEKKLRLYRNGSLWREEIADKSEWEKELELRLDEPGYIRAAAEGFRGRPERGEVVHALSNPLFLNVKN
jgi:hypothetical protein